MQQAAQQCAVQQAQRLSRLRSPDPFDFARDVMGQAFRRQRQAKEYSGWRLPSAYGRAEAPPIELQPFPIAPEQHREAGEQRRPQQQLDDTRQKIESLREPVSSRQAFDEVSQPAGLT